MADITSSKFTIKLTNATSDITSSKFTIKLTNATSDITSSKFTIKLINDGPIQSPAGNSTQIIVRKGFDDLTAVTSTPSTGQYKVTIESTTNCTATLQSDNKTIIVTEMSGSTGAIVVSINIEGITTQYKVIAVVNDTAISDTMTQYRQLADKFTWLVKSGDSQSTMQLTDRLFELVSQNITLTADHINLNGYVSNEDANWSIDNEGNIKAENLKIEGEVGADTLSVNYIDNPCYPATLAGSVDLYVNADTGNDDYTIDDILQSYDEAEEQNNDSLKKKFKTIQGALDASPAFLNNKTVRITLETNTTENIYIRGFTSGAVRIYLNGKTIYGNVHGYNNSATVSLYGGTTDNATGLTGTIHPNMGAAFASRCVSLGFEACQYVALYKLKVFGADNKPSSVSNKDTVCVGSQSGTGNVYCKDVEITNCDVGFRTNNMGCLHASKTSGKASNIGFEATTGGQISIADTDQAGGAKLNTSPSNGGQIWFNSPTFAYGEPSYIDISAPTDSGEKIITIKSTYGDTYRHNVYTGWRRNGSTAQGDYGYGDCDGCWFFGSAFSELKGCTISKVQITITRNSGGSSSAVGLVVRTHNYSTRPSGAPKLSSSSYGTLKLATGQTDKLTITHSDVLNGIKNGTIKGFGIRTTYDSAHYAVCSGNVTVKITYKE